MRQWLRHISDAASDQRAGLQAGEASCASAQVLKALAFS
jgi:hypothetical protein